MDSFIKLPTCTILVLQTQIFSNVLIFSSVWMFFWITESVSV